MDASDQFSQAQEAYRQALESNSLPSHLRAVAHANFAALLLNDPLDTPDLHAVNHHLRASVELAPDRQDFRENLRYFLQSTGQVDKSNPAAAVRAITRKSTYDGYENAFLFLRHMTV